MAWFDPLGRDAAPSLRLELAVLAVLLAFTAVVRVVHWERMAVMFNDGPIFLAIAHDFEAGRFAAALAHAYHPLYSFLAAAVALVGWGGRAAAASGALTPSLVAAGASVSIAAGVASVLFLYLFLRDAFGWTVAWTGALLLAVHARAVAYSADIQSDGLYLALFLASVWLAWRALRTADPARAGWCGVTSGLAYLARPEGLGVAVVAGALALLQGLRREWSPWRVIGWGAALGFGAMLLVAPFVIVLRVETGHWTLTQKKSLAVIVGVESAGTAAPPADTEAARVLAHTAFPGVERRLPPPAGAPALGSLPPNPHIRHGLAAVGELLRTAISAARYEILVLLVLGLVASRGRPGARGGFVGALVGFYGLVLLGLALHVGYVSRRHVLPLVVVAFGYAALGAPVLGRALFAGAGRLRRRAVGVGRPRAAAALGLAVAACVALGAQVRPGRARDLAERKAAEWLRAASLPRGAVAVVKRRTAYYAGEPAVSIEGVPPDRLLDFLRRQRARYAIVDERDPASQALLAHRTRVKLLHGETAAGHTVDVFDVSGGFPPKVPPARKRAEP